MTVAITGSSGFLGRALVNFFLKNKCKIICLVRNDSQIKNSDNVDYISYSDKLNSETVITQLASFNPDTFIHCAWKGTYGDTRNKSNQLTYNIPLTVESVLLAYAAGCKQWIGTGSQAEYGIKNKQIFETDSCDPQSLYGKAKLLSGILTVELCRQLNFKGVWNRIFSLYGPGDYDEYFISYVINSLRKNKKTELTKCEQQWDYLYIDDAVGAIYSQVINSCEGIFNICSGETESLKNVVKSIQSILNDTSTISFGTVPYSENQMMLLSGNSDKLKNKTGWSPKFNLEEGLKQTVNYYLKNEGI